MPTTQRAAFITAITTCGWCECNPHPNSVGKYRVFRHPANPNKLYVGKSGALRIGPTSSNSRPVTDRAKQHLLAAGGFLPTQRPTIDDVATSPAVWRAPDPQ